MNNFGTVPDNSQFLHILYGRYRYRSIGTVPLAKAGKYEKTSELFSQNKDPEVSGSF